MVGRLNTIAMIATIIFGVFGWLAPHFTMDVLGLTLQDGSSLIGLSEIRAANGALFVGVGVAGLLLRHPVAFVMAGSVYAGAALGRLTSVMIDGASDIKVFIFLLVEAVLAIWLIAGNLAAARLRDDGTARGAAGPTS